ncbi:MAG: outer membrane lipoprotein carrier protein LolA [Proteobacteria bacterium]|nr:outer membrane lipoprotein carrier protein LolA [Pseudomonadota bacterium]
MIRNLISGVLVIVFALSSSAADMADDTSLVDRISTMLERHAISEGVFTQQIDLHSMTFPIRSSGRFYFHQDLGIAWYVDQPIESLTTLTDQGIFADGRVVDAGSGSRWVVDLLQAMLRGDMQTLTRIFEVHGSADVSGWDLHLVPAEGVLKRVFRHVDLHGSVSVERVVLTNVNGDRTTIDIKGTNPLVQLPDDVTQALRT